MKRILHVIGGMNRAGAETMIMNIYRVIDHNEFQFDFLVYNDNKQDYEEEILKYGGRVIHLPLSKSVFGSIKSIFSIRSIIKEYGPYCAIHAATLHNSAIALLASAGVKGCRRITHSHSTANTLKPSLAKRIYNKITSFVIRKLSDQYIACGQEAGEYLFGKKLFTKKGIILNNSVDIDRFCDVNAEILEKLKREFNITSDMIVIGSVARLCDVKNHKRMITIAAELKRRGVNFKMIFVGRGELENSLREEVSNHDLNKNIVFAGIRSEIPELMHLFDVFLMPSFFEGNPVTLIEAQAAGLNSVISDIITEKIDMGLGLIHRVSLDSDDTEWVDTICSCQPSRLTRSQISKALSSSGFDLRTNSGMLCDIYIGKNK